MKTGKAFVMDSRRRQRKCENSIAAAAFHSHFHITPQFAERKSGHHEEMEGGWVAKVGVCDVRYSLFMSFELILKMSKQQARVRGSKVCDEDDVKTAVKR